PPADAGRAGSGIGAPRPARGPVRADAGDHRTGALGPHTTAVALALPGADVLLRVCHRAQRRLERAGRKARLDRRPGAQRADTEARPRLARARRFGTGYR